MRRGKLQLTHAPKFGAWTSLSHPSIVEIFSASGVDFVGIDLEHSTISLGEAQRIIAAVHAAGVACLPRLRSLEGDDLEPLLDSGADGIIAPNVSTTDQVEDIIQRCKYPPHGRRSYGVARAQGYGFAFEEYVTHWDASSTILIQIETIEAVEKVERLISFEMVDGVMVGPYDISGSLGIPGRLDHPSVVEACQKIIQTCTRLHKACGTQVVDPTPENVSAAFLAGYSFVVLASDIFLLWRWGARMRELMGEIRDSVRLVKPKEVSA